MPSIPRSKLRFALVCLLASLTLLIPGCRVSKVLSSSPPRKLGKVSENEFRHLLASFGARFTLMLTDTCDLIIRESQSSTIGRKALRLKMRTIPLINDAVYGEDAFESGLLAWRICAQMRVNFESGSGKLAFGAFQDRIVDTSRELERNIVEIISRAATQKEMIQAKAEMATWVEKNPLPGELAIGKNRVTVHAADRQLDLLSTVFKAPLSPFQALEGLDRGATALHQISVVGRHVADVASGMPRQIRWNGELLLYDLEEHRSVRSALASINRISESASSVAGTARDLLPGLRKTANQVLDDLEKRRPMVSSTLAEVHKISDSAGATVKEVRRTVKGVEEAIGRSKPVLDDARVTADSLQRAGQAWTATFEVIDGWVEQGNKPPEQREKKRRPFDIRDYTRTAEGLADAAVKTRQLVTSSRELIESRQVTARVEQLDQASRGLIDHVAWRMGQLIAFCVALLLLYRTVVSRWLMPNRESSRT